MLTDCPSALHCVRRLIYYTNTLVPLRVGLSDGEKLWLDGLTLDELRLELGRGPKKQRGPPTSKYRGVSVIKTGKFRVQMKKQYVVVFSQDFDDETEAAPPTTASPCSITAGASRAEALL